MKRALLFRVLLILARLALAGIFLYAGYVKLKAPWLQFAVSLSSYKLLPDNMLEPVAKFMPWCEVALGVALLSGIALRWVAACASALLAFFFAVMIRSWAAGLEIDCGCFGPGEAIGPMTFVRDGSMLALSLAITTAAFVQRRAASNAMARGAQAAAGSPSAADALAAMDAAE